MPIIQCPQCKDHSWDAAEGTPCPLCDEPMVAPKVIAIKKGWMAHFQEFQRLKTQVKGLEAERDKYKAALEAIKAKGCQWKVSSKGRSCREIRDLADKFYCAACMATNVLEKGGAGE